MDRLAKGKYFLPVISLFPYLLYIVMCWGKISIEYTLSVVLIVCILMELISRYILKNEVFRRVSIIIAANFLATFVAWFFLHNYMVNLEVYHIILEVWLIVSSLFIRSNKLLLTKKNLPKNPLTRSAIHDFNNLSTIANYGCLVHIFFIVIYKYIEMTDLINNKEEWSFVSFIVLPLIFILTVAIYEIIKKQRLLKKLDKESWLPIINEDGQVTGKIAESILKDGEGEEYCYPMVRIALICKNKIFLQYRSSEDLLCPDKLDHPLEKFIYFGHEIEEAATKKIEMVLGRDFDTSRIQYIMKYKFETNTKQRLIFLFSIKIDDESEIYNIKDLAGKFWNLNQIEDAFEAGILSENFELEYEYIKNVVL